VFLYLQKLFTVANADRGTSGVVFYKRMSSPLATITAWKMADYPCPLIAQTSQKIIEATHLQEMQRLNNGGRRPEPFSDFIAFVVLPMVLCLGIIFIGRRLLP
jgi:hypothetical protein